MNTQAPFFFQILSLDADADERAIRRAYARQLKLIDQEADPTGFQQLREAYDAALQWAAYLRNDTAGKTQQTHVVAAELLSVETGQSEQPSLSSDMRHPVERSESDAQGVFTRFMQSTRWLVSQGFVQTGPWVQKLQTSMQDPCMDSLATRHAFERNLVQFLADGWQPGNEALFLAAMEFFNWNEDARRLNQFGFSGQRINRAIDEYAMFRQQPIPTYLEQKELIARLTNATLPSDVYLLKSVPVLAALAHRYPVWLAIITDLGNLQQWQAAESKIGAWTRRFNRQPGMVKPSTQTQKTFGNWRGFGYIVFALIALRFLFGLGSLSSPPNYQVTPSITSPSSSFESYSPSRSTSPYPSVPVSASSALDASRPSSLPLIVPANANLIDLSSPGSLSSALNALRPSSLPSAFPANAESIEQASVPPQTDRLRLIDSDIRRHIYKHLNYSAHLLLSGKNPIAKYFIDLNDDGSLKTVRLIASSGFSSYDTDVLNAIRSAQPYPDSVRRSGFVAISLQE